MKAKPACLPESWVLQWPPPPPCPGRRPVARLWLTILQPCHLKLWVHPLHYCLNVHTANPKPLACSFHHTSLLRKVLGQKHALRRLTRNPRLSLANVSLFSLSLTIIIASLQKFLPTHLKIIMSRIECEEEMLYCIQMRWLSTIHNARCLTYRHQIYANWSVQVYSNKASCGNHCWIQSTEFAFPGQTWTLV